jgi:hypothetical protein
VVASGPGLAPHRTTLPATGQIYDPFKAFGEAADRIDQAAA